MKFPRLLLSLVLFAAIPARAQQSQQNGTPKPQPQDAQAVSVINQALAAAGGATAFSGFTDYTATGTITYNGKTDLQGNVTVQGKGSNEVRLDAVLPAGTRSWGVASGQITLKTEDGEMTHIPPQLDVIPSTEIRPTPTPQFPSSLVFPGLTLSSVVGNPMYNISYKGVVQVDGHTAQDVRLELCPLGRNSPLVSELNSWDIFIDTSTFQIVLTQQGTAKQLAQQLHYSSYQAVSGMQVPFSIVETVGGQQLWILQLSQINFNTGLQDSAFAIQ